jgi:hypothetical protein
MHRLITKHLRIGTFFSINIHFVYTKLQFIYKNAIKIKISIEICS